MAEKFNILKWLYLSSPMNFYNLSDDSTIIKSVNNTLLGYRFNRKFTKKEISSAWESIKFNKRCSVFTIFIVFIILLYGIIFPNYTFLIQQHWYFSVIAVLLLVLITFQVITFVNTKWFERRLHNKFGAYEKTIFSSSDTVNLRFYGLFKMELAKAVTLIFIIIAFFNIGSPFKVAQSWINQERYDEVIKITTIGSKVFPIASDWYSLRAYAKFMEKDYEGAIKDYDKAYRLGRDDFNIINFDNKIYIKYVLKDYDGAIADFDSEIANLSDDYTKDAFLWDKAQFLFNIGRLEDALKIYDDLIIKSDHDKIFLLKNRLYYERAQVYRSMGQEEESLEDILNAEDLNIEDAFKNPIPEPSLLPAEYNKNQMH